MIWIAALVALATFCLAFLIGRSRRKISIELARSWWNSFLSVLLSSFLAISIGLFMYYWQRDTEEDKQREEYMQLLANEIGIITGLIEKIGKSELVVGIDTFQTQLLYLPNIIMEDAGKSGLFPPSRSWNMFFVASAIHEHRMYTDYLIATMAVGTANPEMKTSIAHAVRLIDRTRSEIAQGCRAIRNQLKLPKPTMQDKMFSGKSEVADKKGQEKK